jgi:fructokinase
MSKDPKKIVCFGEVLWDVYPNVKKLGGAPFNVAAHLQQLGTTSYIVSRIGKDNNGAEIKQAAIAQHIDLTHLQEDVEFPTGVVNVSLDSNGKPTYKIEPSAAWDFIAHQTDNTRLVHNADALVYGSLACRSEVSKKSLFTLAAQSSYNICDLNIRLDYYSPSLIEELLSITDLLKINDEEAALLCKIYDQSEKHLYELLHDKFKIKTIVQTKGPEGAEASENHILTKVDAKPITVVDTVGAGDAFFAAFLHKYLNDSDLSTSLNAGCTLGAYVATQSGATPQHLNVI